MKNFYLTIAAFFAAATMHVQAQNMHNGHEYVDLGISFSQGGAKWATLNIGATNPEDIGDLFAWGETETKTDYSWETHKWGNGSTYKLTKYNYSSNYGTVDNKKVLDPEDDAAHVKWGGDWRMPTVAEVRELHDNCTRSWTTLNGVDGQQIISKTNGNSIFLPATGRYGGTSFDSAGRWGYYWSSSLTTISPNNAYYLSVSLGTVSADFNPERYYGRCVRPVISGTPSGIKSIDNEATTRGGSEGAATYNLSGQRVGNNYKGIVIINGKKVVMK